MAKDHGSSVKDDRTYEALRDDGASKGELVDAMRDH